MTVSLLLVINPWLSSDEHPPLFSAQCINLHFWLLAYCNRIALVTVIQEWRNPIKGNEMKGEFLEPLKERHGFCLLDLFFSLRFFLLWTIFKVFTEFVTTMLLFYVLVFWPHDTWDLNSLTMDQTHSPCIGKRSLNNWTSREVPVFLILWVVRSM